jgi:peptide/nickel transport system substrate-binding protein
MNRSKWIIACIFLLLALAAGIAAASAEDNGNVLKLGQSTDEFKLMNAWSRPWVPAIVQAGVTHVPLVMFKPNMEIAPCLATDWDISSDGKSIKFNLVRNATWHDGKPVTAEDVAFSLDYWKKNNLYATGFWLNTTLDHVDVIDDYAVDVCFNQPVATATLRCDLVAAFIVPKHIWENIAAPRDYDGSDAMIGCGPFIFESYDKDAETAYLKANPNYFAGRPSVDKIEWRYFKSLDSLLMALKKGAVDAQLDQYVTVPGVFAAGLIKEDNVELSIVPNIAVPLHLAFGYRQYPMNITEFRQAVSYAVDCESLVEMIAAGYGEVPGKGYTPPTLPFYDPDLPKMEYDPEKAKEILTSAGFLDVDGDGLREAPNGSKLRIPITPQVKHTETVRAAEVIAHQLGQIGLDTYVVVLSKEAVAKKLDIDRDYFMTVGYSTPYGNLMASGFAGGYFVDMPGMYGTCKDPVIVDLLEKSMYAKDLEESDKWKKEIQAYVAREQPIIPLIWGDAIYPVRTDRWEDWTPMYGYGPVNYWSWFNLKPVKR